MACSTSANKVQDLQYTLASLQNEHSATLKNLYGVIHELQKRYTVLTNQMTETESCDLSKTKKQLNTKIEEQIVLENDISKEENAIEFSKNEISERDERISFLEQEIRRKDRIAELDLKQRKQEIEQMEVRLRQDGEDIAYLTAKLHTQRSSNHLQNRNTYTVDRGRPFSPSRQGNIKENNVFLPSPPSQDKTKNIVDQKKPRGGRRLTNKSSTNTFKTLEKIYGSNSSTCLSTIPSERSKMRISEKDGSHVNLQNDHVNLQNEKLQSLEKIYGASSTSSLNSVSSNTNLANATRLSGFKPLPPIQPKDKSGGKVTFKRKFAHKNKIIKSNTLDAPGRERVRNDQNKNF